MGPTSVITAVQTRFDLIKGVSVKMVFHHPLPLDPHSKSASGIRPCRMLKAFHDLGYEVDLIEGYSGSRKRQAEKIKDSVRHGVRYDLMYSESSTMPMALTDRHHLPLRPFFDLALFLFCKKYAIPIGVFYRDIYWLFEAYGGTLNPLKVAAAKAAYRYDLWIYEETVSRLFLPSMEMARYVPRVSPEKFSALPPAHDCQVGVEHPAVIKQGELKLFYVGGMSCHYQLHKLFDAVRHLPGVYLTVCTREAEWFAVRDEYPQLTPNIRVIHEFGAAMEEELRNCDIAVLFVKPQEYWEFASPVKLYEYLGHQKPILASEGTLAGEFVTANGIGWTIPYEINAVKALLESLANGSSFVDDIYKNLVRVAPRHTWQARARQVIEELTK